MGATVREIAEAASVSIATVSRALRGVSGVREDYAARVHRVAEQMNYHRHARRTEPARGLKGQTIAMVLLGIDQSLAALPVIASALQGAEAAISTAGGSLLLASCPDLNTMPASLQSGQIDGVILNGALEGTALSRADTRLMRRLRALPAVWLLGRPDGCEWGDAVGADNAAVGKIAADYLLAHDHNRVALISSMIDHPLINLRQWSFEARARHGGATVELILSENRARLELPERTTTVEDADTLVDRLLALSPRPTGVFVPFDHLGSLIHRALTRRGVAIGSEIELITCNNERELLDSLTPQTATIDIHARTIGEKAVELLNWRLDHVEEKQFVTWSMNPHLLVPA